MAGLLSFGAGASQGLEQLLEQELAQKAMELRQGDSAETVRSHMADETYRNRNLDLLDQYRKDALAEKAQGGLEKGLTNTPIGADVTANAPQFRAAGLGGQLQDVPAKPVTQGGGISTLGAGAPTLGMMPQTQDTNDPLSVPAKVLNLGTQGQQQTAAENASKEGDRVSRIKAAADNLDAKYAAIANATDRNAALADAAQAKIALEREMAGHASDVLDLKKQIFDASGKVPVGSPDLEIDQQGNYHQFQRYHDGSRAEVPMTPGNRPVKPAQDGLMRKIWDGLFGSSAEPVAAAPPAAGAPAAGGADLYQQYLSRHGSK